MATCGDCEHFVHHGYRDGGRDYGSCIAKPCGHFDYEEVYADWGACILYDGDEDTDSSSGGGCYLTSACVEYMGKSDDCEELTVLRSFRDNYMKKIEGGEEMVKTYYAVAPIIVQKINQSKKKNDYYADIYQIITRCVSLIKERKWEQTLSVYRTMTEKYVKEFNI